MSLGSNRRDLVSVLAQVRAELRRCRRQIEDLRGENEILREAAAPLIHHAAAHGTGLVAGNAIMHTDRGGQYHSKAYRNTLQRLDIRQSTSRTGSCLDGVAAESFS